MPISKVKLPNNTTQDVHDSRVVSDEIVYIGDTIDSATYTADGIVVDLSDYQEKLVSGTNIKTVNNQSLLGSGNLTIEGEENAIEAITFNGTAVPVTNKTAAITASTPGTLKTDNTSAQAASASESLSGTINLHKVAKTGTYNDLINTPTIENFYFVQGSSSRAGNATSGSYLSTKWEGTIPGVSAATNGLKIAYRIATNTGVSTAGVVLSIDGTNYYPVVIQKNTLVTTHYPVGSTPLMVFNSTQTASAYLTSNTKTTVTGCWQIMEYDSNTNTYQREYVSSGNVEYPITARYNTSSGESYYAEYGRYSEGVTLNPSTNTITASKFKVSGGTSSQFLMADGSVDSTSYQTIGNKVTSISSSSTDTQYPSAKCIYDEVHPAVATSQPAGGMLPNKFYSFGTLGSNTTFTFATPTDANILNHYFWTFDIGSTARTITWPSGITWKGGSAPTINTNKHYEVSVINGVGIFVEI